MIEIRISKLPNNCTLNNEWSYPFCADFAFDDSGSIEGGGVGVVLIGLCKIHIFILIESSMGFFPESIGNMTLKYTTPTKIYPSAS